MKRIVGKVAVVGCAGALALTLAGCGSPEKPEGGSDQPTTAQEQPKQEEKAQPLESENYDTLAEECSLLQISAPINLSNTGGPICNSNGELIGIGSLYLTEKFGSEGVYYGIELKNLENIINSTVIIKEVLGITEGGILMDIEQHQHGFYVGQLQKDGNAYKSGIKPTNIILSIEGVNVSNINGITEMLNSKNKGDIISCEVLSDGIIKEVEIKIYN